MKKNSPQSTDNADTWFAPAAEPPYAAALFSAQPGGDTRAREHCTAEAHRLAARSPGFIGAERSGGEDHMISAFYWRDRAALDAWLDAIEQIRPTADPRAEIPRIYDHYVLRIATVHEAIAGRCPPFREGG